MFRNAGENAGEPGLLDELLPWNWKQAQAADTMAA
jgi:hypothetical protein